MKFSNNTTERALTSPTRAVVAVERDHLSLSAARHGSVPGPGGARQGWQGQLRFVRILSPSLPSQGELDLSQLRLAAAGTRRRLTERVRRPSRPASKRKKRLIDVDSTVATARALSLAGRRARSKMLLFDHASERQMIHFRNESDFGRHRYKSCQRP